VPESPTTITRIAKSVTLLRSMTCGRLYVYDPILQRLAQDLEDMAAELRGFIPKEHPVVGQGHLARHGDVPAHQPHIRDGVRRGATRTGGDQGRAIAGEAGDAVHTGGLKGFGEGHGRYNRGETAG